MCIAVSPDQIIVVFDALQDSHVTESLTTTKHIVDHRHHRRAYALALGVVKRPEDASDVVQEAYVKGMGIVRIKRIFSEIYTYRTAIAGPLAAKSPPTHRFSASCNTILSIQPIEGPPLPQRAQQIR